MLWSIKQIDFVSPSNSGQVNYELIPSAKLGYPKDNNGDDDDDTEVTEGKHFAWNKVA